MRKKLQLYYNSFKESVCAKPTPLLMFIAMIIVVTVAIGMPSRLIVSLVEDSLYAETLIVDADNYDYNDYRELGQVIDTFNDSGVFEENSDLEISLAGWCVPMVINGNEDEEIQITRGMALVINGHGFTESQIDNGSQVMLANPIFMNEYGIESGDEVEFCGSEFVIYLTKESITANSIYIPYTAEIANFEYTADPIFTNPDATEYTGMQFYKRGPNYFLPLQRLLTASETSMLDDLDVEQVFDDYSVDLILPIVILLLLLIGGVLNILVVTTYMQKISSRRYAIYKIIGMSPTMIGSLITAESMTLATVGVGLGLLIDILINTLHPVGSIIVDNLMWIHCLLLVSVTLVTTIVTVIAKVVAHSKAVPVDVKYLA